MVYPGSPSTYSSGFQDTWRHTLILSWQSLGVVYGRLCTAPLYVFGSIPVEDFQSEKVVYEYCSFIFWTLTIISLFKYVLIVLRADDNGEGGPFALYSLLCRHAKVCLIPDDDTNSIEVVQHEAQDTQRIKTNSRARRAMESHKSSQYLMLLSALFGACMIIGDAVLTPSISVLSASSGLQRSLSEIKYSSSEKRQESMSNALAKYIPVPFACAILVCVFMLQRYGTGKIGYMLAPIVGIWLMFIAGVGLYNICRSDPNIISALSPTYMYKFVRNLHKRSWRSLGGILLCAAGSEAMFADLGHFSKKSVQITFTCLVYPLLIFCYAGQAAYISKNLHSVGFNHLSESVPKNLRHVFILLSLFASVSGSQATITASFSIIKQCLALNCFPRVEVVHTSDNRHGQVYIPDVNWLLMVLSLGATIIFHDIHRLASATGLAIVSGMMVTTCLMSLVISLIWEKPFYVSGCFLLFFGCIEAAYISACLLSFHEGGWYLLVVSVLTYTIMLSWHYGTKKKYEFDVENKVSTEWLTDYSPGLGVSRVPGIGIIYSDIVSGIPAFFSHFVTNLPAFHQVLIFVSFKPLPVPHVPSSEQYLVGRVGLKDYRIYRCIVRYGYCDHIRDTDDFEEHIISSIGEFISLEENDSESLMSAEGRMLIVGMPLQDENALITFHEGDSSASKEGEETSTATTTRRKKVRFMSPRSSPKMRDSVRTELLELIDARESGTAYFLGQSHLTLRGSTNFMKRFLIKIYAFLDKNCREPQVALNIPHAALVEVGMVYTI